MAGPRRRVVCLVTLGCLALALGVAPAGVAGENQSIGVVDGYAHDASLPVDDRPDATVSGDELEAVIARSMARVEVIRGLDFAETVEAEVRPRSEFEGGQALLGELTDEGRLRENVLQEALFTVERDQDAIGAYESLLEASVGGYYDPETDRIVLISDGPDGAAVDEIVLGHELVHALQDQHWNLETIDRSTADRSAAANGLIEGDASVVDRAYDRRCAAEWDCLEAAAGPPASPSVPVGLFLQFYHPYSDGPAFVEALRADGGWAAVDDRYDDVPSASTEIIHPGVDAPASTVTFEDRSSDRWSPLTGDSDRSWDTLGEVTLASMVMHQTLAIGEPVVLDQDDIQGAEGSAYSYAHDATDGWAGDRFVAYGTDAGTASETGYVWEIDWVADAEAERFVEAYLTILEHHGATPVEDRSDTFTVESDFPGAYHVALEDETVRIVNTPSVDALSEIDPEAAPVGPDRLPGTVDGDDGGGVLDPVGTGGLAAPALVAIVLATALARRR